ncbi:hypothetical protein JCM8097_005440 [Rhodosporidiobolus ruineniae]
MLDRLPVEAVQTVIEAHGCISSPAQLPALALVCPSFRIAVRLHLLKHVRLSSSSTVKRYLEHVGAQAEGQGQARSLTVEPATRKLAVKGKGKKAKQEWVQDDMMADEVVKLCGRLSSLEEVHLREVAFSTFRRRQVDLFSSLTHLHTLTISGRSASQSDGFNLHTVGQLLLTTPHLTHLALRNLSCFPSALDGLSRPHLALSSFALFDSPGVTAKQLSWLLDSSTDAESLRTIAFDLPACVLPSTLYPVRWAPIRTTSISCTSDRVDALENLPRHCPSLRRFTFRTSGQLDPYRLLASCDVFGTVTELRDASQLGCGVPLRSLAEALLLRSGSAPAEIARISLRQSRAKEGGFFALRGVCRVKGVELRLVDWEDGEPFVPDLFRDLRTTAR